jgi:hypothetical protein
MMIDGKRYAPEDVVKLFITYVGGNLIYQQVDQCDDVIEEDMTLMSMRILYTTRRIFLSPLNILSDYDRILVGATIQR